MLTLLDELLRTLLRGHVPTITTDDQIGFQPPDEDWVTLVKGSGKNALNLYLIDLRENRRLRSNERERERRNGVVLEQPAPARVECQYILTAWSPATVSPATEPVLDEHGLLYAAAVRLVQESPFNPSRVYAAGSSFLNAWPEAFRAADLPTMVLPVDGFARISDFWTTMGKEARWRPAIHLLVTIPLVLAQEIRGYPVRTAITRFLQDTSIETLARIGGEVLDPSNPLPNGLPASVPDAWVRLLTPTGAYVDDTTTDASGRFHFSMIVPASYRLEFGAVGFTAGSLNVEVPSTSGKYDLLLS